MSVQFTFWMIISTHGRHTWVVVILYVKRFLFIPALMSSFIHSFMPLTSSRQRRCHAGWSSPLASPPTQTHRGWNLSTWSTRIFGPSSSSLSRGPKFVAETLMCDEDNKRGEMKRGICGEAGQSEPLISSGLWSPPNKVNSRHGETWDWLDWIVRDATDILKPSAGASERERKLKISLGLLQWKLFFFLLSH